nr:DNA-directed DNA polymerase [Tanacetum cinerariifolium]
MVEKSNLDVDKEGKAVDPSPKRGKDYAKTVKNQSKPSNIRHEIERLHQELDQGTFFCKNQVNKAKKLKDYKLKGRSCHFFKVIIKGKMEIKHSNRRRIPNIFEPEIRTIKEIVLMVKRTMEELLQAPTEGYGEAIVISEILAENFEIKTNLLQLVQANKFHDFERDNPHTHISNFKRMTATLKYRDVPNDAIKLMIFPYSLEGAARIWDNVSKTDDRIDKLVDQISNLVEIVNKQVIAPVKAVEKTCVTCGGAHAYYDCIATDSDQPSVCAATGSFFQYQPPTSGTLPSNNVPNPKGEMKALTTRSGLAYEGPLIPTSSPLEKVDEQNTEEILDKEHSNCPGSTAQVQPLVLWDALLLMPKFASTIKSLLTNKDKLFELAKVLLNENCSAMLLKKLPEKLGDLAFTPELTPTRMTLELADRSITYPKEVAEDVFVKVGKFHFPTDFVVVDFEADPRVPIIIGGSFMRTGRALIDVYGEESTLRYNPKSSNPTLVSDASISESESCKEHVVKLLHQHLLHLEKGDILYLENLLNEDPFQLHPMDLKLAEESKAKSSIEEPPELELKELSSHLEYAFLEDSNKLPVIIAKNLKDFEIEALINVLKSHKRAISWKISDIKGINPRFYTHKILMEDDYKPAVQSQRRVNPKIHDVIKKEVIKLLDVGMIYPISDCPWVSLIHCVPKKGGITVVANENNELILTRLVTGWRVCIDYRKLNDATRKDHFLLPFMDQMLERLAGNEFYCFLDGFSGPMTHLLEKETPFVFSKECIDAFDTLKKKLTEAPILVVPDWNLPFELMCDASDYVIDAVLGQRKTKHFQPFHYASKTMTEAQIHYTTTKKEMLAVVYAFEKFRPYLVLSKSIVYTDHSALKYLLNKQDAKP